MLASWAITPLILSELPASQNNGGTLEVAQRIAGHADSRTTKLYDRRGQKVLLEDLERNADLGITFRCSQNPYLKRYAGQNEKRGGSRTFVIADRGNRVVGYYTLTVGSIEQADAPAQVTKGMGKYSIQLYSWLAWQ